MIDCHCFHLCSSQYSFELCPGALSLPIGCVSLLLSFPSAQCLCEEATISLLLPRRREKGVEGEGKPQGGSEETLRSWLHRQVRAPEQEDAELLCGPVRLKPLVDITGCSVQVSSWLYMCALTSSGSHTLTPGGWEWHTHSHCAMSACVSLWSPLTRSPSPTPSS